MDAACPPLIAVTPNPAIDVTITVDTLVDEATHRIDAAQRRLGGKGINVAAVAAAQGYPAAMLGPVSTSSLELLKQRGLDLPDHALPHFSTTDVALRETWAIHRSGDNATVIINEAGGTHSGDVWEDVYSTIASLGDKGAKVVTISGSWPPGTDADTLRRMIDTAKEHGVSSVIVDCAGENLTAAARAGAIVKPNAAEITETTGCSDPIEGATTLIDAGCPLVVASLGPDGLIAVTAKETVRAKLATPLEGNPTGAGDALVAALATGLIDDLELEQLLTRAVAWSAAAVLVPYAGAIDDSWPELATQVIITRD